MEPVSDVPARPAGIPGSDLSGPWSVGDYAAALRDRLRGFARVQVFGEVFGFKAGRAKVWFELRDAAGALPCSMWRRDWEALGVGELADGLQVVVAGGCDYYPGSRTSSPSFSFTVADVRVAGEGDLLAQIERLRRTLHAEGLFEPQKQLARPALPRTIGVVTGETGKARDDVVAGLRRRGWGGRLVWAFAPVQDRHAAPRITRALQDLAACEEVEVIVVARGGGSLADLFAFCDETLCRTVALLRVPVISSVGHHTDRTLLDDVAAVACSTPTHAAEAAVPVHCADAHTALRAAAVRLERQGRRAIVERARTLARLSRAPAEHVARHRVRLHQELRELRAAARRGVGERERITRARAGALQRKRAAAALAHDRGARRAHTGAAGLERGAATALDRRRRDLERFAAALAAHDPQRTLERGYALLEDPAGEPVTSAADARAQPELTLRLHDGRLTVRPDPSEPPLT
jgi:exodeoxyribonuclease VII large subunit